MKKEQVIVFEKSGEILLADIIDTEKILCHENFTNFTYCPKKLLDSIPDDIVELCKKTAPHYLHLDSNDNWASTMDPTPQLNDKTGTGIAIMFLIGIISAYNYII